MYGRCYGCTLVVFVMSTAAAVAQAERPGGASERNVISLAHPTPVDHSLQAKAPATALSRQTWNGSPMDLTENSWDFTAPNTMPGFGPLRPDEIERALAAMGLATVRRIPHNLAQSLPQRAD
jgi:hypothetical protein